jgi:parallel beta-helix repeat protein
MTRRTLTLVAAAVVPLLATIIISPSALAGPIDATCSFTKNGNTWTLTTNCSTTGPLTVPNGITIDGAGHTISANNPPPPAQTYTGAVVTNAAGSTSMNIKNLTITGPTSGFEFPLPANSCNSPFPGLFGIFFNDAGGSVDNVKVFNMFQTFTGPGSPACQVGHGIRVDGPSTARTVNITNATISGYQKGGIFASGNVTMNITSSKIGPPSFVPFSISQNGVQWTNRFFAQPVGVGATGTMTNSTITGSSFSQTHPVNPASSSSAAVLLYGSHDVTVDHNTINGSSDLGISVTAGSANSVISFNAINRPNPPTPDTFGVGVSVDQDLETTTTLICNTFSGWKTDIEPTNKTQEPCPPSTTTTTTTSTPIAPAGSTVPTTTAPVAPTAATLPVTGGGRTTLPLVGIALVATGLICTGIARRARERRKADS